MVRVTSALLSALCALLLAPLSRADTWVIYGKLIHSAQCKSGTALNQELAPGQDHFIYGAHNPLCLKTLKNVTPSEYGVLDKYLTVDKGFGKHIPDDRERHPFIEIKEVNPSAPVGTYKLSTMFKILTFGSTPSESSSPAPIATTDPVLQVGTRTFIPQNDSNACVQVSNVFVLAKRGTELGACAGEVRVAVQNRLTVPIYCEIAFHKNGMFQWGSPSGVTLNGGESVQTNSLTGIFDCGTDSDSVKYRCWAKADEDKNNCLAKVPHTPSY